MYKEKIDFFDAQADAPWADGEYDQETEQKIARLLDLLPRREGLSLLEPGCGTGRLTQRLAQAAGPAGTVTALDISPRMAEAAQRRLSGLPNARALAEDLETCATLQPGFDAVICHQVFPHFNDPARALARMAELLKPGGVVIVSHFIGRHEVNDVHRKAGTAVEQDMLPDAPAMRSLFHEAGFEVTLLEDLPDLYLLRAGLVRDA